MTKRKMVIVGNEKFNTRDILNQDGYALCKDATTVYLNFINNASVDFPEQYVLLNRNTDMITELYRIVLMEVFKEEYVTNLTTVFFDSLIKSLTAEVKSILYTYDNITELEETKHTYIQCCLVQLNKAKERTEVIYRCTK